MPDVDVVLGEAKVGELHYQKDGRRERVSFVYDENWAGKSQAFPIDPLLPLVRGHQYPQGQRKGRSPFFNCFADSEPDGWGRTVIRRDRLKRGIREEPTSFAYLTAVHDESRVGALRFRQDGVFLAQPLEGHRAAPPMVDLQHLLHSARAVEEGTETAEDLRYLLGQGSPLGGQRPKATIRDDDGALALGKFPSVSDERDVVRGEILALLLAKRAGIDAAHGRLVVAGKTPVAVIGRFDRDGANRIFCSSAETFLGIQDEDEHSYLEMVDALRQRGAPKLSEDIEELWRRLVFSILISNFDDHLHNHAFLHVGHDQWRLAPAFDINPTPNKAREFKTWISAELGPEARIQHAVDASTPFGITPDRSREIVSQVESAISQWRRVATSPDVGMTKQQCDDFADAFEHEERLAAKNYIRVVSVPTPRSGVGP